MKKKLSLKNENRGASLIAVLIVLVVISAIAVVITNVTITNIQMKEVERGTKKNFYSAESVMDALHAGAGEKSADALKAAYTSVMENYLVYTASGKNLQDEFKKEYVKNLENIFNPIDNFGNPKYPKNSKTESDTSAQVVYSIAEYDTDVVKSCIGDTTEQACYIVPDPASDKAKYEADYNAGTFTLKNVAVAYKDSQNYETTITTDFVFTTPTLNFDGGDEIKEFMKYALIADTQIHVNANSVKVDGNAYAGTGGILADSKGSGTFNGKVTVTRGDIATDSGSSLVMGNGTSSIWASNVETLRKPSAMEPSTIELNGNSYIEDDLSLNGVGSTVTVKGNYYGYNFQKNYGTQETFTDGSSIKNAAYNSAMMINAKKCKLDLSNINYLMLSGRTFVSRGKNAGNNDVMLGESLSVRTNQLAYYVPDNYVDKDTGKFKKIKQEDGTERDCAKDFETYSGVSDIYSYLDGSKPLVAYHYVDTVMAADAVVYYLNFASEQKANDYFTVYCNSTRSTVLKGYAKTYLANDAIILNDNAIMTLRGDILYRKSGEATPDLYEKHITIDNNNWKMDASGKGVYAEYSAKLAMKYKALQLSLNESHPDSTAENVRITEGNDPDKEVDKTKSPLFDTLIDKDALAADVAGKSTNGYYVAYNTGDTGVILANNTDTLNVPSDGVKQGIVVATGNVQVVSNFRGLIISGGTITFNNSATVTSDKMLVADLFKKDMESHKFSQFFKDCAAGSVTDHISGNVDINTYLTYENWKKN